MPVVIALGCMALAVLIQLVAACVGVVGSLFFAIGVIRQNTHAMARLSFSYFDGNPHMPAALASQRAEYIFGGGFIVTAFALQFASFFTTDPSPLLSSRAAATAPWIALVGTLVLFFVARVLSRILAKHFQAQVEDVMRRELEEDEQKVKEQRVARKDTA